MVGYLTPVIASDLASLHIGGGHEARTTIGHLLEMLHQFPMLEELSLHDVLPGNPDVIAEQLEACMGRIVRLDYLKKVTITANGQAVASLWKHLSLRAITELSVTLYDTVRFGHGPSHAQSAVSEFRNLLPTHDSLRIMRSANTSNMPGIVFYSSTSTNSFTLISPNIPPQSSHLIGIRELVGACAPFLAEGQIRTLDMQDKFFFPYPEFFNRVFYTVGLLSCALSDVNDLCTESLRSFPSLHTLILDVDYAYFDYRIYDLFEFLWNDLLSLLRERRAAGCDIQTLRLVGMDCRQLVNWPKLEAMEVANVNKARSLVTELFDERLGLAAE
jgi:hypothetical protein